MAGHVTPLHPDDDEDSEELDGDEEWLGTEGRANDPDLDV